MESISKYNLHKYLRGIMMCLLIFGFYQTIPQLNAQQEETNNFIVLRGKILDGNSKKALEFGSISLNNSNISTISNIDGEFSIKYLIICKMEA